MEVRLNEDLYFNELYIWLNVINRGFINGTFIICEGHQNNEYTQSENQQKNPPINIDPNNIDLKDIEQQNIEKLEEQKIEEPIAEDKVVNEDKKEILSSRNSVKEQLENNLINNFALKSLGLMILGLIHQGNPHSLYSSFTILRFIDNDFNIIQKLLDSITINTLQKCLNTFYILSFSSNSNHKKLPFFFLKKYIEILKELKLSDTQDDENNQINYLVRQIEKMDKSDRENLLYILQEQRELIVNFDGSGKKSKKKRPKRRKSTKSRNPKFKKKVHKTIKRNQQIGGTDFNLQREPQIVELSREDTQTILDNSKICVSYTSGISNINLFFKKINPGLKKQYLCVFINQKLIRLQNFLILKREGTTERFCLLYTQEEIRNTIHNINASSFFSGNLDNKGENNLIITPFSQTEKNIFKIEFSREDYQLNGDFYFTLFPDETFEYTVETKYQSLSSEIDKCPEIEASLESSTKFTFITINEFNEQLKFLARKKQLGGSVKIFNTPNQQEVITIRDRR